MFDKLLNAALGTGLTFKQKLINAAWALLVPVIVGALRFIQGENQAVDMIIVPVVTVGMYIWYNSRDRRNMQNRTEMEDLRKVGE